MNKVLIEDETVVIDGHHYINCIFRDCRIQYSGGPFKLSGCRFEGEQTFASAARPVVGTIALARAMELVREEADYLHVELPEEEIKRILEDK